MSYCPSCGAEVAAEATFCGECGEALTGDGDGAPTSVQEPAESTDTGGPLQGRFWVNSLIGGVVGFVLGIVLASVMGPVYLFGIFAGGALGGFLQATGAGGGAKVGLLSGIIATIPFLLLLAAALTIGVGQALAVTDPQVAEQIGVDIAAAWTTIIVIIGMFGLVLNGIFGLFGGLVGGVVGE